MKKKNYYENYCIYRAKCMAHDGMLNARQRQNLEKEIFNKFIQGNIDNEVDKYKRNEK